MTTEIAGNKKGSRRSVEKMTVVDSLAAAYEKQDLSPEEWDFVLTFFSNDFDIKTVSRESLDRFFAVLRDITDRVALINSPYPSDIERAFVQLEEFMAGCKQLNLEEMKPVACKFHLSHLTFHRETVADIIAEARELLIDERRPYLQRLVAYQRDFITWLNKSAKSFS